MGQKEIAPGVWAMFAGDVDQTDAISYDINGSDNIWYLYNGNFNIYLVADCNLDGDKCRNKFKCKYKNQVQKIRIDSD